MGIFKFLIRFFEKNYWVFLLIVVVLSYGQMLGMYVWKDDNAIFFKFNHLNEAAGYLGKGLFGQGPYRFSVTPYFFVYKIFGTSSIVPYYLLAFFSYLIATFLVYKLFSQFISKMSGKLAGFLFASGYVSSEGFIWLASSMIQSVSVIITCLLFIAYHKYSVQRKIYFYFFAVVFYFLVVEITPVRVHYLILVIILFDFLFVVKEYNIKKIGFFLLRQIPFLQMFLTSYLLEPDSRSGLSVVFIKDLVKGDVYKLYSFIGSFGNLFLADKTNQLLLNLFNGLSKNITLLFLEVTVLLFSVGIVFLLTFVNKGFNWRFMLFIIANIFWYLLFGLITNSIYVSPGINDSLAIFTGGEILLVCTFLSFYLRGRIRRLIVFLEFWCIANLFIYTSYQPTSILASTDRYLVHSFLPIVALLSMTILIKENFLFFGKKLSVGKMAFFITLLWGMINVLNSVTYQHSILENRSIPAATFYKQLRGYLPEIKVGDIVYVDVANDALLQYQTAFSVGQMPETTALAWRYGLDRYDFMLTNDYHDFINQVNKKGLKLAQIHSYFYSKKGLTDTSNLIRKYLSGDLGAQNARADLPQKSLTKYFVAEDGTRFDIPDLILNLSQSINSSVPVHLTFNILASQPQESEIKFPLSRKSNITFDGDQIWKDSGLREKAFSYQQAKTVFYNNAKISASSEWNNRAAKYLFDQDPTTIWQSNRTLWKHQDTFIQINLPQEEQIDRLAWINGFSDHTPVSYSISVSQDGVNWREVKTVNASLRLDQGKLQVISFPKVKSLYVKLSLFKTIGGDSPSIAEIWPIESRFDELDIDQVEEFLQNPYDFVLSLNDFLTTQVQTKGEGKVQLFWQSDKDIDWLSAKSAEFHVLYDGLFHEYSVNLPPGGISISRLKFSNFSSPGSFVLNKIRVDYPK